MDFFFKWLRTAISILLCFTVLLSCVYPVYASGVPALPPGSGSDSTVVVDIGSIKEFFIGIQEFWEAYSESREAYYEEKEAQAEAVSAWLDTADKAIGYLKEWFGSSESDDEPGYDDFVASLADTQEVSLHLDPSKIETWDSLVDNGYILSYSSEPNSLDYVIGKNCYWNYARWYWQPFYSGVQRFFFSDEFYIAEDGTYTITFPNFSATLASSLTYTVCKYVDDAWVPHITYRYSASFNENSDGLIAEYVCPGDTKTLNLLGDTTYYIACTLEDNSLSTPDGAGYYNGASGHVHFAESIKISSSDASGTVYDPSDPEQVEDEKYSEETRMSVITQLFSDFNKYTDNSVVANYYIGTLDESQNVTNYYDVNIFDEQSKVFTEPVTGAQYLATNWTYNYESRAYGIALEAGSMYIGNTEIPTIVLQYGDDAVTIYYVDAADNIVQTDEYAYVMVASNECALNGHCYNTEITKEPTCTSVGQQTSTCSICGDQTTEQIPMNEHTSTYSVFKEPSCSDSGIALYTCSVCGTQYTEMIDSLGHDWLTVDSVETTYTLPPGTSCPDCAAEEFTYELDKETALYTCTCSCGASWTADADVTEGYTKYSCNRCGATKTEYEREDGDGLFNSLGNFIADGISWCTEKLSQLVDSITSIIDTFNGYLDTLEGSGGSFPGLIGALIGVLPEDLMALVWLALIGFVILAVWKGWLG